MVVEGVAVDTMYDAFPVQLVWTPLAWHALLTALAVGGLGRMAGVWPLWRLVLGWLALGLLFGAWALWWPAEVGKVPDPGLLFAYLCGLGLALPLGHLWLSRIGHVPRPHGAVLLVLPVLFALAWAVKMVLAPVPVKLALPVMAGLTLWAMVRRGRRGAQVSFGAPVPAWLHALALLTPGVTFVVIGAGWGTGGGLPTNIIIALATGVVSLGLWVGLVWMAARRA